MKRCQIEIMLCELLAHASFATGTIATTQGCIKKIQWAKAAWAQEQVVQRARKFQAQASSSLQVDIFKWQKITDSSQNYTERSTPCSRDETDVFAMMRGWGRQTAKAVTIVFMTVGSSCSRGRRLSARCLAKHLCVCSIGMCSRMCADWFPVIKILLR